MRLAPFVSAVVAFTVLAGPVQADTDICDPKDALCYSQWSFDEEPHHDCSEADSDYWGGNDLYVGETVTGRGVAGAYVYTWESCSHDDYGDGDVSRGQQRAIWFGADAGGHDIDVEWWYESYEDTSFGSYEYCTLNASGPFVFVDAGCPAGGPPAVPWGDVHDDI